MKHLKLVHSQTTVRRKSQPRDVTTLYTFRGKELKTNRATNVDKAVMYAVEHMRLNNYGATVAQIYSAESGELYATVKRPIGSSTTVVKYGE